MAGIADTTQGLVESKQRPDGVEHGWGEGRGRTRPSSARGIVAVLSNTRGALTKVVNSLVNLHVNLALTRGTEGKSMTTDGYPRENCIVPDMYYYEIFFTA